MNFAALRSDGTAVGTALATSKPEERAVLGEELWWAPTASSGVAVTPKTSLQLSAFLAGLTVLGNDIGVLPLRLYQRINKTTREERDDHPNHELLARSPDGERTPIGFKRAIIGHAAQHGNGYAEIERTGRGRPAALHLLDPETTRAERIGGKLGYRLRDGKWLPAANVVHISGFGFDGLTGYDLVRVQNEVIGLGLASQSFAADHFANGSEPGGVIETPHRLNSDAFLRLRDSWDARHGGPGKRFRTAILEQGAKFNATSTDPEKSQLLDTRKFQVLESIRMLRVPPNKVGDLSQAHLANMEASNLDYLTTAILSWLIAIEQEFNLKLLTRQEWLAGYYHEHNVETFLRGDIRTRYAAYSAALDRGWMSRNEVRAKENMNPIPAKDGGDLYTVQSQNIPLSQTGTGLESENGGKPKNAV